MTTNNTKPHRPAPEGLEEQTKRLIYKLAGHMETGHPDPDQTERCKMPDEVYEEIMRLFQLHLSKPQPISGDLEELKKILSLTFAHLMIGKDYPNVGQLVEAAAPVFQSTLTQFKERAVADIKKINEHVFQMNVDGKIERDKDQVELYAMLNRAAEAIRKI